MDDLGVRIARPSGEDGEGRVNEEKVRPDDGASKQAGRMGSAREG